METPIRERGYATSLNPSSSSSSGLSIGVFPPPSSILAYARKKELHQTKEIDNILRNFTSPRISNACPNNTSRTVQVNPMKLKTIDPIEEIAGANRRRRTISRVSQLPRL